MGGEVGGAGGVHANARAADLADLGIVTMGRECARQGLIREGHMGAVHAHRVWLLLCLGVGSPPENKVYSCDWGTKNCLCCHCWVYDSKHQSTDSVQNTRRAFVAASDWLAPVYNHMELERGSSKPKR